LTDISPKQITPGYDYYQYTNYTTNSSFFSYHREGTTVYSVYPLLDVTWNKTTVFAWYTATALILPDPVYTLLPDHTKIVQGIDTNYYILAVRALPPNPLIYSAKTPFFYTAQRNFPSDENLDHYYIGYIVLAVLYNVVNIGNIITYLTWLMAKRLT
jgi:hypothetical protein